MLTAIYISLLDYIAFCFLKGNFNPGQLGGLMTVNVIVKHVQQFTLALVMPGLTVPKSVRVLFLW